MSGISIPTQASGLTAPEVPAENGALLLQAAGVYAAVAAERAAGDPSTAELYALRAIEMLRQAHAAGYFQSPLHRETLKNCAEFNGLRQRRDFQLLLKTIES
jgi:hypothetical protein